LGAAISVAVATAVYPDYETAVSKMIKQRDEFFPNAAHHEAYNKINAVYRRLPERIENTLKSIYEGLH
jgi:ribulose kinase